MFFDIYIPLLNRLEAPWLLDLLPDAQLIQFQRIESLPLSYTGYVGHITGISSSPILLFTATAYNPLDQTPKDMVSRSVTSEESELSSVHTSSLGTPLPTMLTASRANVPEVIPRNAQNVRTALI